MENAGSSRQKAPADFLDWRVCVVHIGAPMGHRLAHPAARAIGPASPFAWSTNAIPRPWCAGSTDARLEYPPTRSADRAAPSKSQGRAKSLESQEKRGKSPKRFARHDFPANRMSSIRNEPLPMRAPLGRTAWCLTAIIRLSSRLGIAITRRLPRCYPFAAPCGFAIGIFHSKGHHSPVAQW